ncbi:MAG: right-handed parallel beta-helix repeat-containing protein [Candidatus Sungbacteria bacterium]|nr:right-handed parallel beta-helix repeat-containing protein [Candidatus Sungbacteria bacterium]
MYPFLTFAYSDTTTHPALTQEIVKFFNQHFPQTALNQDELELVVKGSIDEDKGIRWMRHFYDPVYDRGLVLEDSQFPDNPHLAVVLAGASSRWESAKTWAQSSSLQSGMATSLFGGVFTENFSDNEDYSWERAIYEYAWADKNYGLRALGHVLHLLEDASVPDHTRNDPHPNIHDFGSPYENWTKKFDRRTLKLTLDGEKPIVLLNIEEYFNSIATYSNNNFFSKDTIFSKDYIFPKVSLWKYEKLGDGLLYKFGYSKNGAKLVFSKKSSYAAITEEYFINDPDNLILSNYWSLLSKQAVLHGAGAIKLFFDEAAKEKQTKALYNKNRSWIAKKFDSFSSSVFGASKLFYGSSVSLDDLENPANPPPPPNPNPQPNPPSPQPPQAHAPLSGEIAKLDISNLLASLFNPPPHQNPPPATKNPPPPIPPQPRNTSPSLPIAGGGGPSPAHPQTSENNFTETTTPTPPGTAPVPPPSPSTSPPNTPTITFPGSDNEIFTSSSLAFAGSADLNTAITTNFSTASTSVSGLGTWSLLLDLLPQGTSTIQFFSRNLLGILSNAISRTFFIDSTAPSLSFAIAECAQSLSPTGCLAADNAVTLEWNSSASDLSHYQITCIQNGDACGGFSQATTTATSTVYTLPADNTTYVFSASATDRYGNESSAVTQSVAHYSRPLIINEIAWAGTASSFSQDEWIELYNPTTETIDLSDILLKSQTDGKPNISLTGNIPPGGYYIIERTDDDTISDVTASATASFGSGSGAGLANSGEVLALEYQGAILDQTPEIADCGGWCGGNTGGHATMERIDPATAGTEKANWITWTGFPQNGKAADGTTAIAGTPGKRNSASYLIDLSINTLTADTTLTKSGSPYLITADFLIPAGKTLTLEAGTIVKFVDGTNLTVAGILNANGSENEQVVFTAAKDDSYGGDTNSDDANTWPQYGDWKTIKITGSAVLDYTKVRFGGMQDFSATAWALINGENCNFTANNSTFEFSGAYGIWLKNCTGTLDHNAIQYNNKHHSTDSTGLIASDSSLTISSNTFFDNNTGLNLYATGGVHTLSVTNNNFIENENYAVSISNVYPVFSGNTASGNGINGIFVAEHTLAENYTFTADLPYILQNITIPSGKTLTFDAGAVMKFNSNASITAEGTIVANGTAANRVIFTSLADDDCGIPGGCGDTNGTSTTLAIGDWQNISFLPGSMNSSLQYTTIRYGGGITNSAPLGALRIQNAPLALDNIIIEHNRRAGIFMQQAGAVSISNSLIQRHNETAGETDYGIFLSASSTPAIQNTIFRENENHIVDGDGTSQYTDIGGNVFE